MYLLENIGWKITQISNSSYLHSLNHLGKYDYNITHRIFAPFGIVLQRVTIKEVVAHIEVTFLSPCKFLGETLENLPRREYSFKYPHDQEAFAKLWNGWQVTSKIEGNWNVLI